MLAYGGSNTNTNEYANKPSDWTDNPALTALLLVKNHEDSKDKEALEIKDIKNKIASNSFDTSHAIIAFIDNTKRTFLME